MKVSYECIFFIIFVFSDLSYALPKKKIDTYGELYLRLKENLNKSGIEGESLLLLCLKRYYKKYSDGTCVKQVISVKKEEYTKNASDFISKEFKKKFLEMCYESTDNVIHLINLAIEKSLIDGREIYFVQFLNYKNVKFPLTDDLREVIDLIE